MRKKVTLVVSLIWLCAFGSTAGAQSRGEIPKIGVLFSQVSWMEDFLHGLRELGYVIGKNVTIVHRNPDGREESYPALANELVSVGVDLIVVGGLSGARAAQKATKSIPIVIAAGGDPVGSGLVASLARPGGKHYRQFDSVSRAECQTLRADKGSLAEGVESCGSVEPNRRGVSRRF